MTAAAVPNQLLIGGRWCESATGERLAVIDPATGREVDSVPVAARSDLDEALRVAASAWGDWREVDVWTRSAVLRRAAELVRERAEPIAETMTQEQGKPLAEARSEVGAAADQFDWYADEARRMYGRLVDGHSRANRLMVMRQPVGPVAAFTPWNFPALLPARKLAPAIAAGCSVILKPAEEAPRTAMHIAVALQDAGLPDGVLGIVTGHPAEISEHLIASDVIRKVTLTGSVPVGRRLLHLAADGIKSVSMELGGHSPLLVFADADVEEAAEVAARGKFRNSGQVCICASRFFVQDEIAADFTEAFVEVARGLRLGPGGDPATEVGPLSNERRLLAAETLVADAVGKGAHVVLGGRRPENMPEKLAGGFWFEPTVLVDVTQDMAIMSEEPFCPVAPIVTFADLEDGLAKANDTPYGLAGYVFTNDTRTAFLVAEGLEVGMVGVNNVVIATAEAPFGGVKQSGVGREGGAEGIDAYLETKYVNVRL